MKETEMITTKKHALIDLLTKIGVIKYGDFELSSGKSSSIYIDLRSIIAHPQAMRYVAYAYMDELLELSHYDLILGIPYGALPIATVVAFLSETPLVYIRKEPKMHGVSKNIEGEWEPMQHVVIIDDVLTTGNSIAKTVVLLRSYGLVVDDAIVMVDRQQEGVDNLRDLRVNAHAIFTLDELLGIEEKRSHPNG